MRFRFRPRIRWLMLAVAVAAVVLAGVALWRRPAEPPLPLPWFAPSQSVHHNSVLYVNGEDVRLGIDPPRAKWVHGRGKGVRIEDAPGAIPPGWSRRKVLDLP
jgi:hypothetical protein